VKKADQVHNISQSLADQQQQHYSQTAGHSVPQILSAKGGTHRLYTYINEVHVHTLCGN